MRRSLWSLIILLLTSQAWGAVYYVDQTGGNDNNAGTSTGAAWKTISKVNGVSFSAGDKVLFKRGETWREKLTVPTNGNTDNPITFGAYGTGNLPVLSGADKGTGFTDDGSNHWKKIGVTTQPYAVFINGAVGTLVENEAACTSAEKWYWASNVLYVYATSDPSGNVEIGNRAGVIYANGKHDITVDSLYITGSNDSNANGYGGAVKGIYVYNFIVKNSTIKLNGWEGITFGDSRDTTTDNNTISYNTRGIATSLGTPGTSYNHTISNNTVRNNMDRGISITSGSGSTLRHDNVTIFSNQSYNNCSGIFTQFMDNSNIYSNTLYNNTDWSGNSCEEYGIGITSVANSNYYSNVIHDGHNKGIQIYGDNTTEYGEATGNNIYRNQIYNYPIGLELGGLGNINNTKVYYNIIYNNTIYNIVVDNAGTGNAFYNNTIHGSGGIGVYIGNNLEGLTFKNNIFSGNVGTDLYAANLKTGLTTSNNLYYRTSGTLLSYNGTNYSSANIATFEVTAVTTDPRFTTTGTDFTLQSSSYAINAGTAVGLSRDFMGNFVPLGSVPDIGAYEFNPGGDGDGGGGGCSISPEGKLKSESRFGTMLALFSPWIFLVVRKILKSKKFIL